jgi:hypothetical protein
LFDNRCSMVVVRYSLFVITLAIDGKRWTILTAILHTRSFFATAKTVAFTYKKQCFL